NARIYDPYPPITYEYCYTLNHGTCFWVCSSLHHRPRPPIPTRRTHRSRMLSHFHRHHLRCITITPRIRQALRSVTSRRYPGGVETGSTGSVHPTPHRPTLYTPRPWHRIPVSPGKH